MIIECFNTIKFDTYFFKCTDYLYKKTKTKTKKTEK